MDNREGRGHHGVARGCGTTEGGEVSISMALGTMENREVSFGMAWGTAVDKQERRGQYCMAIQGHSYGQQRAGR